MYCDFAFGCVHMNKLAPCLHTRTHTHTFTLQTFTSSRRRRLYQEDDRNMSICYPHVYTVRHARYNGSNPWNDTENEKAIPECIYFKVCDGVGVYRMYHTYILKA